MNKADSERFSQRHAACTSMRELLHQADWPTNVNELPVALTGHLGASPYKGMDLSKAGYKFDGAGPCMAPGEPSAHLIYRPVDDQNQTPISLWLRPDDGRYDIPENMTHQVNTEGSSTPIYIWRHSGIIYYMVGDSMSHVMEAKSQFAD
jgi:anti-sigma factor RsiW